MYKEFVKHRIYNVNCLKVLLWFDVSNNTINYININNVL